MNRPFLLSGATAASGLLTVTWPVAWAPSWSYVTASLGAGAVLAAAILRWRRGPGLAAAAAIVFCAISGAAVAVLAAEGLFILATCSRPTHPGACPVRADGCAARRSCSRPA